MVQWAIRSKPCYHCQEGQLAEVKNSTSRQAASKEVYNRKGSTRVQAQQPLKLQFVMVVKGLELWLAQHQGCKTTQEHRKGIE